MSRRRPNSHPQPAAASPEGFTLSAAGLHALLGTVADVVAVVDAGGIRRYVNSAAERLLGYRPEELIGKPIAAIGDPDQIERMARFMADVRANPGRQIASEFRVKHRDGTWRWMETVAENRLADPAVAGIVLTSRDVTARKAAEENGARWTAIAESSDVAIVGRTLDGVITSWNPGAERLYGYTAVEAIGHSVAMLIPPEQTDDLPRLNDHLDQGERIEGLEARRVAKDGRFVDVLLNLAPIRDPSGTIVGVSAVALDITARKAAEAALRASEVRFRALVQNAGDLISVISPDGTILYQSPALERLLGYRPEERAGTDGLSLIHPDDRPAAKEGLARIAASAGASTVLEFRVRHRDGSWRWLESHGTNLLHEPSIGGFVVNSRDITERREAEATRAYLAAIVESSDDAIVSRTDIRT